MSAYDTKYGSFGTNWGMPQNYQPQVQTPDQGFSLSKSDLDGTNIFGANSAPGAWGDWGSTVSNGIPAGEGGILGSLKNLPWLDSVDAKSGMKSQGMLGAGIGAASSIFNAYMGMKQYGLAKEQFKFNKDMTTRNFNAQANMTNSNLADRQTARNAAGGGNRDVAGYMADYGVKKI